MLELYSHRNWNIGFRFAPEGLNFIKEPIKKTRFFYLGCPTPFDVGFSGYQTLGLLISQGAD